MDIFTNRNARAMLIGRDEDAFDDPAYLYEIKLDGDRCLAYLDPAAGETVLINKRGRLILLHLPELADLHTRATSRCILDGELLIGSGLKCEFERIRSRLTLSDPFRIQRQAKDNPASFVAFDILYKEGQVTDLPLEERKDLLEKVFTEDQRLVRSRVFEGSGVDLFRQVQGMGLEGVVAKRKGSVYHMGKRSPDWVKFKHWEEGNFVICGYWPSSKADNVVSLVVGQYRAQPGTGPELVYKGHVVLGRTNPDFTRIDALPRHLDGQTVKWGKTPADHPKTIWLQPVLVCRLAYMCSTPGGGLRQPFYKGLRPDTSPADCIEPDSP